jgi:hypothetical protein
VRSFHQCVSGVVQVSGCFSVTFRILPPACPILSASIEIPFLEGGVKNAPSYNALV